MKKKSYFLLLAFSYLCVTPLSAGSQRIAAEEQEALDKTSSGVHGFFDVTLKNDYITPRGLLVTNNGVTVQILAGGALDLYNSNECYISNVALVGGVWNDLWTNQNNPNVGAWNEMDWFCGFSLSTANNFRFSAQFLQFLSPPGNFKPENNVEFLLTYEDGKKEKPFSFNPYVKVFWTVSGDSTVVVGRKGKTYDVEIGLLPTWNLKTCRLPATLYFPTWITVGPASFWNGGKDGLKQFNQKSDLRITLPKFFQTKVDWYLHAGAQYYYLINTNLLQAQAFTLGLPSYKKGHRSVGVAQAGVGFEF
jgi:hypothetical protein